MQNYILKGLFVFLMMTSFNTYAAVIVARQQEIKCECTFDYLHKSSTSTDGIPANTINTHLTIGCNTDTVSTEVTEYALWKVVDGNYVDMVGVKLRQLNPGRYSLSADPSECENAPKEGLVGVAIAYFTIYSENPDVVITNEQEGSCEIENTIINCPPPA